MQCLATFDTTHATLKFEKTCSKAGLDVRIVPVPRELSSSCGFACEYRCELHDRVLEIVKAYKIAVSGYHRDGPPDVQ